MKQIQGLQWLVEGGWRPREEARLMGRLEVSSENSRRVPITKMKPCGAINVGVKTVTMVERTC